MSYTELVQDAARLLAVLDADHAVKSAGGRLGQARKTGKPAERIAEIEAELKHAQQRLALVKAAA